MGRAALSQESEPWARGGDGVFVIPNYSKEVPELLLVFTICVIYAPLAPLVIPAGAVFFWMALVTQRFAALYMWRPSFQSQGNFFSFFLTQAVSMMLLAVLALLAALVLL